MMMPRKEESSLRKKPIQVRCWTWRLEVLHRNSRKNSQRPPKKNDCNLATSFFGGGLGVLYPQTRSDHRLSLSIMGHPNRNRCSLNANILYDNT